VEPVVAEVEGLGELRVDRRDALLDDLAQRDFPTDRALLCAPTRVGRALEAIPEGQYFERKSGRVRAETLAEVEPPSHFAHRLSEIRGPMAGLVVGVDGRWEFAPAGRGVRVTWRWDVIPTAVARPMMPVFARMWRGYAARALDVLEAHRVSDGEATP